VQTARDPLSPVHSPISSPCATLAERQSSLLLPSAKVLPNRSDTTLHGAIEPFADEMEARSRRSHAEHITPALIAKRCCGLMSDEMAVLGELQVMQQIKQITHVKRPGPLQPAYSRKAACATQMQRRTAIWV